MKKFIYSLAAVLALSCTFISCGSDDDDENISYSTTPEKATVGTYNGTFTKQLTDSEDAPETGSGTITLSDSGITGVSNVAFSCPALEIDATSVANIANANRGFYFLNQIVSASNTLETAFSGRIDEGGNMVVRFSKSMKVGRKNYTYTFVFEGAKQ